VSWSALLDGGSWRAWAVHRGGRRIAAGQLVGDVLDCARQLPSARYALNLCDDRYAFLVGFLAALLRGQTNLLPSSRVAAEVARTAAAFESCYALADSAWPGLPVRLHPLSPSGAVPVADAGPLGAIADEQLAALLFTSGSTGEPCAHGKQWGGLLARAALMRDRLGLARHGAPRVVATVPPQHMFGLELSIMLPLVAGLPCSAARPFFPLDVRHEMVDDPGGTVLVSTPTHLGALVQAGLRWPAAALVVSSTAALDVGVAAHVERQFRCPLMEVYGSTETGALASRRTVDQGPWHLLEDVTARVDGDVVAVSSPFFAGPVALPDRWRPHADRRFDLDGRIVDVVKIAGKRVSLADVTARLLAVDGVVDAVVFVPDEQRGLSPRLAALVVAPGQAEARILGALAENLDPVLLPRPLVLVERLPRNEVNKLPRAALLAMLGNTK